MRALKCLVEGQDVRLVSVGECSGVCRFGLDVNNATNTGCWSDLHSISEMLGTSTKHYIFLFMLFEAPTSLYELIGEITGGHVLSIH
jgi:hypothetical protein